MKIKRFNISAEAIKKLFDGERHNFQITGNALPADAELVRVFVDQQASTPSAISLFYVSESFPDVIEGMPLYPERFSVTEFKE